MTKLEALTVFGLYLLTSSVHDFFYVIAELYVTSLEETKTSLSAKIEQKSKEFHFCCLMSACYKNMREGREVAVMTA